MYTQANITWQAIILLYVDIPTLCRTSCLPKTYGPFFALLGFYVSQRSNLYIVPSSTISDYYFYEITEQIWIENREMNEQRD